MSFSEWMAKQVQSCIVQGKNVIKATKDRNLWRVIIAYIQKESLASSHNSGATSKDQTQYIHNILQDELDNQSSMVVANVNISFRLV